MGRISVLAGGGCVNSRYAPPAHPLPDNLWHTFLAVAVGAFLIWHVGVDVGEIFQSDTPQSGLEKSLTEGGGPILFRWLEDFSQEDPDFLWVRLIGILGWLMALGSMARFLMKRGGLVSALPSVAFLFLFPQFTAGMVTAGAAGFSAWCFLRAFRIAQEGESRGAFCRGGLWLGIAAFLQGAWILPAIGLTVGLLETRRRVLLPLGICFLLSAGALFGGSWLFLDPSPAGPAVALLSGLSWGTVLLRHGFLLVAMLLMLGYGATRRGIGWWSLVAGLVLPLLSLIQGSPSLGSWLPLLFLLAMGLSKLPVLLDLRHPRAYQSILLCQLLLWVPAALNQEASESADPEPAIEEVPGE